MNQQLSTVAQARSAATQAAVSAQLHGGSVEAVSAGEGKGSTFAAGRRDDESERTRQ